MKPDDFSLVDVTQLREERQWQAQYRTLMRWGEYVQTKAEVRTPENKIRGCSADAWLEIRGDIFYFDSDSRIINGLAALLLTQFKRDSENALEVLYWQNLFQELGLQKHLSPSRNNGFQALVRRMQELWKNKNPLPEGEGGINGAI
ncbi:MAG: SufE family protein [Cellvibrionaceae bacterium]|nr:SufE family protein [Cellvibrionaceae bacterium]